MALYSTRSLSAVLFLGSLALAAIPARPAYAQAQPTQPVTTMPSEATVATNKTYRIRPGDELLVTVYGETTLSPATPVMVVQGGLVTLPLIGDVNVGGLTTTQANDIVEKRYEKYVRNPKVTVAVYSVGPVEALVLGNVKVPGKYTLPPPARLTDVIAAAGGLGPTNGDLPDARVESPSGTLSNVSLQKLLRGGDTTLNAEVPSGSTVYVPSPTSFEVIVSGAVDKPGDVTLNEGDDVAMAIARAGASSNSDPDLNHVAVRRQAPDGTQTTTIVNLYPILKDGDMSHDIKLQKGDLVYVPKAAKHATLLDYLYPLAALRP